MRSEHEEREDRKVIYGSINDSSICAEKCFHTINFVLSVRWHNISVPPWNLPNRLGWKSSFVWRGNALALWWFGGLVGEFKSIGLSSWKKSKKKDLRKLNFPSTNILALDYLPNHSSAQVERLNAAVLHTHTSSLSCATNETKQKMNFCSCLTLRFVRSLSISSELSLARRVLNKFLEHSKEFFTEKRLSFPRRKVKN